MTSPWKGKSLALASWISVTGDDAFGLVSIDRAQDQSLSVSIGHRDRRAVASEGAHPNPAKVSGFVIDAGRRQVVAVTVKGSKAGDVIEWAAITAFGADAVTVPSESAIPAAGGPIRDLADKDHRIMGKLVLSTDGDAEGVVTDVEFDGASGRISFVMVDGAPVAGDRLVGRGRYAVVIRTA